MKVTELIEKLKKEDLNAEVVFMDDKHWYGPVKEVCQGYFQEESGTFIYQKIALDPLNSRTYSGVRAILLET
jgi:hypothetical protein